MIVSKLQYIHCSYITRKRWALYSRVQTLGISDEDITNLLRRGSKEKEYLKMKFTMFGKSKDEYLEKMQQVFDRLGLSNVFSAEDLGGHVNGITVDEVSETLTGTGWDIASRLGMVMLSTQASETIHNSLKHSHKIKNLKNLVFFSDAMNRYLVQQDARIIQPIKPVRTNKFIRNMRYLAATKNIRRLKFMKEFVSFLKAARNGEYSLHKFRHSQNSYSLDPLLSCSRCLVCRVLQVPCKHVLASYFFAVKKVLQSIILIILIILWRFMSIN